MISDDAKNERSTIYQVLERARASLSDPKRPTTPAESMRRSLFSGEDYRPESRPTSAFHLDGGTSDAFHINDDIGGYDNSSNSTLFYNNNKSSHSNDVLNSNTGYGQSSHRRQKKAKKKRGTHSSLGDDSIHSGSSRKENERGMVQQPASEWGWGVSNDSDNVVEVSDIVNQPFQVTITKNGDQLADKNMKNKKSKTKKSKKKKKHDLGEEEGKIAEVEKYENGSLFDNPSSAEIAARFQALKQLENGILSELDPKSPPDILLLKLAAVEASISDLTMGGIDSSNYSIIGMDGKSIEDTTTCVRRHAMRALYKLVKVNAPRLQLCVAKLILRLAAAAAVQDLQSTTAHKKNDETSRRHKQMITALRLLFSLSKTKKHDALFRKERIIHTLLELLSGEAGEARKRRTKKNKPRKARVRFKLDILTFATGTLKNVCTLNKDNQKIMAQQGAITTLGSMMSAASKGYEGPHEKQVAQLLIQITGILRNLSCDKKHLKQFWTARVVQTLCNIICTFPMSHSELMLNIVRIFSKLSLHAAGRSRIAGEESEDNGKITLEALLALCYKYKDHNAMLVRTCFVLGNLTAGVSDDNRCTLADALIKCDTDEDGNEEEHSDEHNNTPGYKNGVAVISNLLALHTVNLLKASFLVSDSIKPKETAEVLVKIVRLIANMSIATGPGNRFARSSGIKTLVTLLADVKGINYEELQLNVVSAISNLSFYAIPGNNDAKDNVITHFMETEGKKVINLMTPLLLENDQEEGILEAARAFANFSRCPKLRDYLSVTRSDEVFVLLLEHENRDIVMSVCGVLMNLAACDEGKQLLRSKDTDGINKLLCVVRDAGTNDLEMSTLACKVLHNACLDGKNAASIDQMGGIAVIKRISNSLDELVDVVEDILNDEADDQKDKFGDYAEDEHDLELERRFLEVGSSLLKLLSAYNLNNNDEDKGNDSEVDDMIPLSETEDDGTEENSCSSKKK
jgi:hypothetical protein